MDIKEALSQMDSLDDEQWTQGGDPKTDFVSELTGEKVTRAEIIAAAPKFTRENLVIDGLEEADEEVEDQLPEEIDTTIIESYFDKEPMVPEEFIENILRKLPENQLEDLQNLLIQQQIDLEKKQSQLDEMKRRVKFNISYTRSWIKQLIPDMSNQQAIRKYIENSNKQRAQKAQEIKQVLGGLKPSDIAKLDPRAAIDRAFARKTGRGGQRPTR